MSESERQKHIVLLRAATARVQKYCEDLSFPPPPNDQELRGAVESDLASNPLVFDADGYTASAANLLQPPIRQVLIGLASARRAFDDSVKLFEPELRQRDNVPNAIADIEKQRDAEIDVERQKFNADEVVTARNLAKAQYEEMQQRRPALPNLKAVNIHFPADMSPLYIFLLLLVGLAEFFINFKLIEDFLGIPFAAFASSAVMAAVLAAISHVHGVDIKQFQHKFGRSTRAADRPWLTFVLAWLGLAILLLVVGWMRYEAVSSDLQTSAASIVLIPQGGSVPNLGEEVVISLGANLLAWFLGVFLAASFHDADPDYVDVAIKFMRSDIPFQRRLKRLEREQERIEADAQRKITEQKYVQKRLENDPFLQEADQANGQIQALTDNLSEQSRSFLAEQGLRYKVTLLQRISGNPESVICRRDANGGLHELSRSDIATMQVGTDDKLLERMTHRR